MYEWTESDFDNLFWHDCRLYAWEIREAEPPYGTLILDIDFITAWEQPETEGAPLSFQVAPATLVFFDILELKMSLEFNGFPMAPIVVDNIDRELRVNEAGYRDFIYSMVIADPPHGFIRFSGNRFRLKLRAAPICSKRQRLDAAVRPSIILGM